MDFSLENLFHIIAGLRGLITTVWDQSQAFQPITSLVCVAVSLMIIRNIGRCLVAACVKIARGRYRTFVINNPYVIDGDTLAAGDIRIRIWGIDAPEIAQQQGPAAKLHLKSLVAGKAVHVKPRSIDQYNRTVAQIFVDSRDIGACMVEDGFAIASTQFTRTYTKPMKRARRAKAGLWRQGGIENPISFRRSTI